MAYKKYYSSRYRKPYSTYKKYTPPSRWKVYSGAAGQLWKDVKMLKNMINVETKYAAGRVNSATLPAISAVTTPYCTLNGIAEGDTQGQRSGISIKAKSFVINGQFQWNTAGAAAQTVRMVVVRQRNNRGLDCDPTKMFDVNNCPTRTGVEDYTQILNNKITCASNGYVIMSDRTFVLSSNKPDVRFKVARACKFHVKYNGANAATSYIEQNVVQVFVFTDQSTNVPTGSLSYHFNYIDN